MRRRGSLGPPLLLALGLYSAWSPSDFVASPSPRPRRAVCVGAAGDDQDAALRNLLLSDSSSAGVEAPTQAAAPAAKEKEAAPAEKAAKAPAPAPKAAEQAPAKVAEAPADDLKAPVKKEGGAAAQSESRMPEAVSVLSRDEQGTWRFKDQDAGEPSRVLSKDDQGRWRFVEVDREAALLAAFQSFDVNGDGELCRDELKGAAAKFGESEDQIGQLLKQLDGKKSEGINFDQFKELIASVEESCDVEQEVCFDLRKPSTWGLLFRKRRK